MPVRSRLANLWRDLFHRDRLEQEFTEELQAYLELSIRAKIIEGLPPKRPGVRPWWNSEGWNKSRKE